MPRGRRKKGTAGIIKFADEKPFKLKTFLITDDDRTETVLGEHADIDMDGSLLIYVGSGTRKRENVAAFRNWKNFKIKDQ